MFFFSSIKCYEEIVTFSRTSNDDRQTIKPRIAKLNIGDGIDGIDVLSIKQLITQRGPRTLKYSSIHLENNDFNQTLKIN